MAKADCYTELLSVSVEESLCNYLAAFDGTKKDFNDIRPYVDDLFSDNLIHLMDGNPIGKTTFTCINKSLLEQRFVATLEDIDFVDDTHIEYTVHWGNECTSLVTHIMAVVADGKILKMQPCEETKGVFSSMSCNCHSSPNPLHQLMRFQGGLKPKQASPFFVQALEDGNRFQQLSPATLHVSPQKYLLNIGNLVGRAVGSLKGDDERLDDGEIPSFPPRAAAEQ